MKMRQTWLLVLLCFACLIGPGQTKTLNPLKGFQNPFVASAKSTTIRALGKIGSVVGSDTFKISAERESFFSNVRKFGVSKDVFEQNINSYFGLNGDFTFRMINSKTDDLGFIHVRYDQYYKGYPIDAKMCLAHFKDDTLITLNGQIASFVSVDLTPLLAERQAFDIAKEFLKADSLLNQYPVEMLVAKSLIDEHYHLTYKVRIDAIKPVLQMKEVFVDAITGEVVNVIDLINNVDITGSATTLYRGTQSITCDSYAGSYRLRETARNIQTFLGTNAGFDTISHVLTNCPDFVNPSTTWSGIPYLSSFTISAVAQSWWYAPFADVIPDLFIVIKDASNQIVYSSVYYNDSYPAVTFNNLNIYLTNPPYTAEIWDYDAVGGNDYGGSYVINSGVGAHSWSGGGNNGYYSIVASGHPALDVHWGMEKTYDFYSSVFGRNSFDGLGSVIKNYLNTPLDQPIAGCPVCTPNNAAAYPAPYNFMHYGMGDGSFMTPVVGLDVEGHEYSHMVINNNGNGGLVYQRESGALNESFADIFGTCVENYAMGSAFNWTIGENVVIPSPNYLRSMSNPNSGYQPQPDTYGGLYWSSPNCGVPTLQNDNCGVHTNSGVQNFWFYLLCQGGSGTNDLGNNFSVSGIGITQARQIAYKNLITYLPSGATYMDAYNGSLQAADDLFGYNSTQYNAVRAAWWAVGIGTSPVLNTTCSGTTWLTSSSGTISDGSSNTNYSDNLNCKWVIAPPGATQITLNFTAFALENGYDTVFVYGGTDTTGVPLIFTGTTLPPTLQTPVGLGAVLVKFKTDINTNAAGWTLNYTSTGVTPTCDGGTLLKAPTGSLDDGSGVGNYANNQLCYWFIAPPCATSVTLNFTSFNTELGRDGIIVYDGDNSNSPVLLNTSGTALPASVTSSTGKMLVVFISDYANNYQGFTANYTSTGSNYCSVMTTYTADAGSFSDGSGSNNYCNNAECTWLIQPAQATSVTLSFSNFDLENASSDGFSVYDAVEVYDGSTMSAPLLGRFAGNNIPPTLTSTGGSLFVRFYTDYDDQFQGFNASYTSTTPDYCSGTTTLTGTSGSFSDGSGVNLYGNNANCSWLIQPNNVASVTLSFPTFSTEPANDGVIIYDGPNDSYQVLAQYSGTSLPSSVTSTQGSMFVKFLSNPSVRYAGWTANYTTVAGCSNVASAIANGATTFCPGDSVLLSASNGNSYQWKRDGIDIPGANSANYFAKQTGSYAVVVTVNGCSPITSAAIVVNTYSNPNPTISTNGPLIFCQGGQVTLSVSGPFIAYTWSNGVVANSQTIVGSGNYSVTVKDGNGCFWSSDTIHVIVNPSPLASAGNDQTIAQGNSATLTASGGTNYHWSTGGNTASINVSPVTYTTYSVTVTDVNGCTAMDSVSVIVTDPCINSSLSNQNQTAPSSGGSYTVNIYIATGCNWGVSTSCPWVTFPTMSGNGAASVPFTVQANSSVQRICSLYIHNMLFTVTQEAGLTNLDEIDLEKNVSVYPNPTDDKLFLNYNDLPVEEINLYNATGALIKKLGRVASFVDVKQFSSGFYILEFKVGPYSIKRRWIRQ